MVSVWGSSCPNGFNYISKPHNNSPLPSLSPPGYRGILRYETSVYPSTLPSPQPGTMRTKDKNFHYLAPLLGVSSFSFSLLSLSSFFFPQCSLALHSKAFSNEGCRSPDRLRPSFCFCLLIFYSFPFSSKAKREGTDAIPTLLDFSPPSNFPPPIFSRVPKE